MLCSVLVVTWLLTHLSELHPSHLQDVVSISTLGAGVDQVEQHSVNAKR